MKSINALAKELARLEGKKSQARIGDIKEILSILSDFIYEENHIDDDSVYTLLWENGYKRTQRKKK